MTTAIKRPSRIGRATLVVLAAILSTACSSTYSLKRVDGIAGPPQLDGQGGVYVSATSDGAFNGQPYVGSGMMTSSAVVGAFSAHAAKVTLGVGTESEEESSSKMTSGEYMYRIIPTIMHWEDRATEWSGISDVMDVQVEVFDAESGELLDSVTLHGVSKWMTMGGDHPQDLLAPLLSDYVETLYVW